MLVLLAHVQWNFYALKTGTLSISEKRLMLCMTKVSLWCIPISLPPSLSYPYTPSQRGNYHHSMFHNPTAAVNLFHVGKQYLTFCKAEAAVTHNLIGRKIISNVKHSDARNSLPILDVKRSSHKRHSASEYCK